MEETTALEIKIQALKAQEKAELEGLHKERELVHMKLRNTITDEIAKARTMQEGKAKSDRLKDLDRQLVEGDKKIRDMYSKDEKEIISRFKDKIDKAKNTTFYNVKSFLKKLGLQATTAYKKVPYRKSILAVSGVLASAVFVATYRRYKKLEDERLKRFKDKLYNK
jgi:hypothetical protein